MNRESDSETIFRPGDKNVRRDWCCRKFFTVDPHHVGIIIRDGAIWDIFSGGQRRLPKGQIKTYVTTKAPFKLAFWLPEPDDPSRHGGRIPLDFPALTSDSASVTGEVVLTLALVQEQCERLRQIRPMDKDDRVTVHDVGEWLKGELQGKVLSLDLNKYTAQQIRGNRKLLEDMYESLRVELTSSIRRFGLRLEDFYANWDVTDTAPPPLPDPPPPLRDTTTRPPTRFTEPAPRPPRQDPPVPPAPSTSREEFYVYTDLPTGMSKIHKGYCRYYKNRKPDPLPDNWWHGPYSSSAEALAAPQNKGRVMFAGCCCRYEGR